VSLAELGTIPHIPRIPAELSSSYSVSPSVSMMGRVFALFCSCFLRLSCASPTPLENLKRDVDQYDHR